MPNSSCTSDCCTRRGRRMTCFLSFVAPRRAWPRKPQRPGVHVAVYQCGITAKLASRCSLSVRVRARNGVPAAVGKLAPCLEISSPTSLSLLARGWPRIGPPLASRYFGPLPLQCNCGKQHEKVLRADLSFPHRTGRVPPQSFLYQRSRYGHAHHHSHYVLGHAVT